MPETELDKLPMREYKAARDAGKETVSDEEEEAPPPEITGKEDMKEFKEKREEQIHGAGVKKRIDRLVKQRESAREESEKAKKELAELKARYEPEKPDDGREMRRKEFDRFNEKIKEAREERKDWEELESAAEQIRVTPAMQAQIISFENGHDVAVYLAEHPDISRDLHKMGSFEAMRKLDRISLKLELDAERKEQRSHSVSRPYAPIKPVTGGATRSAVPLDEMDMKAFKKAREAGRVR